MFRMVFLLAGFLFCTDCVPQFSGCFPGVKSEQKPASSEIKLREEKILPELPKPRLLQKIKPLGEKEAGRTLGAGLPLAKDRSLPEKPSQEKAGEFPSEGEMITAETKVEADELPEKLEFQPQFKFEIGASSGLLAGATAFLGEARIPLRYVYGPATSSFRVALGYAQSKDGTRRYIPLQLDGILNFPPGIISGIENYLGMGLNYVLLTSGRTAGTIGGEVFYGVESEGFGGKLFGEMGYGMLRTGFSPMHNGVSLLIGYRRERAY